MSNGLNGKHHAAFKGLPEGAHYCWVQDKAPKYTGWNQPNNLKTPQQILETTPPNGLRPNGFGMVSGRWSGVMAVDFDANPDDLEQTERTFRAVTGRPSDDLPPSATVISGRPGRRRVLLRIDPQWNSLLSGWSAKLKDLEFRWECGWDDEGGPNPKPIQSVICGEHPKSSDWHFRWMEGASAEQVGIAEAPTWLIGAMIRQFGVDQGFEEGKLEGGGVQKSDGPQPMDSCSTKRRIQLVQEMSAYWPCRGGLTGTRFQASYEVDGYNSLLAALWHEFGEDAVPILEPTDWFKNSEDFGCSTDLLKAMKSVAKSKKRKGGQANMGTLVHLARRTEVSDGVISTKFDEPPWPFPRDLLPPAEVEVKEVAKEVTHTLNQLKENLQYIDELEQPAAREVAYQRLQKKLGCTEREMKTLLRHLDQENDPVSGGKWSDVVKNAKPIVPAIERLLPANCVTMVASDGGVGKSVLLYRIAEAAAYGGKVFGKLQANQGNVLIVQTDESDSNLQQKSKRMEFRDPKDRIHVEFAFNAGMFPDLRNWIRSHGAKYVLMDSFGSLFAGGAELSDSEAGMYLYKLNKIAAEEGCAILMTHHLRKQDKSKNGDRQKVTKGDLYGSAYIVNGCSDVWGITVGEDDQFSLTILKDRSGVSQRGDTFALAGSKEDLSFELSGMNADEQGIDKLKKTEKAVLKSLRARGPEGAITQAELAQSLGKSPVTVFRVVTELYAGNWGIQRRRRESTGGNRPWEYWVGGTEGK